MERWVIYAVLSAVFAGIVAVLAKQGLDGISAELGMVVRTAFILALTVGVAGFTVSRAAPSEASTIRC